VRTSLTKEEMAQSLVDGVKHLGKERIIKVIKKKLQLLKAGLPSEVDDCPFCVIDSAMKDGCESCFYIQFEEDLVGCMELKHLMGNKKYFKTRLPEYQWMLEFVKKHLN